MKVLEDQVAGLEAALKEGDNGFAKEIGILLFFYLMFINLTFHKIFQIRRIKK